MAGALVRRRDAGVEHSAGGRPGRLRLLGQDGPGRQPGGGDRQAAGVEVLIGGAIVDPDLPGPSCQLRTSDSARPCGTSKELAGIFGGTGEQFATLGFQ